MPIENKRTLEEKVDKIIEDLSNLKKRVERLEEVQEELQKDAKVFDV